MAKIPDYTQIKREIPQVSGDIDVRGVGTTVAPALMKVAGVTAGIQERKSKNTLAKAESGMFTDLIAESNAYDQDPDYGTFDERFTGNIEKKLGEHASTIADPMLREQFIQRFRPKIAQSLVKIQDLSFGKESEFERGELATSLKTLRDAAVLSGGDDILGANDRAAALIQSNVDLGYIGADDAVKFKASFKDDVVKGRIELLPPEERVGALKQKWAKNLPPDELAGLKRKADEELLDGKAMAMVQDMEARGINLTDSRIEIKKIKDPKLRKTVQVQRDYAFQKRDREVVEHRTNLGDKWFDDLALGEKTVEDIQDAGEWDAMGKNLQREMLSAQRNSVKSTTIPFSLKHHDALSQKKIASDRGVKGAAIDLRNYVLEHQSEMPASQAKGWLTISIDGLVPDEVDSGLTDMQSISAMLPETSDADKRRVMIGTMGEWRKKFISQFGKAPTPSDRDDEIDRLFLEYDKGFFGIDTPYHEMSVEDRKESLMDMKSDNPNAWKRTQDYFVSKGYVPNQSELMQKLKGEIDAR